MNNKWYLLFFFFSFIRLGAQQLPGTEIYLFDLKKSKGNLSLSNPRNITNHPGYDNQPFFHPDKSMLYYASGDEEGRTDIIEYNYETGVNRKITNTKEREYSPTITPDNFISCIIQRDSGEQDLGKYPLSGGEPVVIISTLKVGYHAWADQDHVFVFALGEPNTLRLYYIPDKKDLLIQENIGRSLHHIPGTSSVSFVHKMAADKWLIKRINEDGSIEIVGETLPGREDLTWTSDGKILMSDGQKFYSLQPKKDKKWKELGVQSDVTLKTITRIAVNSEGTQVAVVVSE